jgi:cell division inhibitor SepF
MGSWRRVGAFLGLVPDDSNPYDNESYDSAGYDSAEYDSAGYEAAGYENAGYDDGQPDRGARSGGSPSREADRPGGYADSAYPDRKADSYASESYRTAGSTPQSARTPRRSFGTEPVTQGALAMKADQRRDSDTSTASRPASVKLTGFGEARIVGEKYRDGQSVILDMTGMSDSDARRLVDFSAGLAFSLRGSIEKVAPKVFMLLPAEADIAGGAANALENARAYVGSSAGR